MKRRNDRDVVRAFHRLTYAAEAFVNRAPRVKRIHAERAALLDAITNAQLVLSVHRLPKDKEGLSEATDVETRASLRHRNRLAAA